VSTPPRVVPIPAGTRTQELGRVYIVEEGDSLSDIARRELGNSARAGEIQALNREVLGSTAFLRPGLELILPR
jgi:nucleoid-associated protein YgaU